MKQEKSLTSRRPVKKLSRTSGKAIMVKTSSMSKNQKRSYKKYRGQGR